MEGFEWRNRTERKNRRKGDREQSEGAYKGEGAVNRKPRKGRRLKNEKKNSTEEWKKELRKNYRL